MHNINLRKLGIAMPRTTVADRPLRTLVETEAVLSTLSRKDTRRKALEDERKFLRDQMVTEEALALSLANDLEEERQATK